MKDFKEDSLALIVLNYNDWETTKGFVKHIQNYSCIDIIIIVDNKSTDDSVQQLNELVNNHVKLILNEANNGYASGNNYGIRYAIEHYGVKYVIVSNPDVEFNASIIKHLKKVFELKSNAGLVSCKMNNVSSTPEAIAWKRPSYYDCLMQNFIILKKIFGARNEYPKQFYRGKLKKVEVLPGSFFMIPSDVYQMIGGLDEGTFLYFEENILSFRLQKKGYMEYLVNDMEYIHRHSISIDKNVTSALNKLKLAHQSRKYYSKKYLGKSKLHIWLLELAYIIGSFDYVVCKKMWENIKNHWNIK